jgi:hypothetical protein
MRIAVSGIAVAAVLAISCVRAPAAPDRVGAAVDTSRVYADLGVLAADSMEGRGTGSEGIERARRFLRREFQEAGLRPYGAGYDHPFEVVRAGQTLSAANVVGHVPGSQVGGEAIVVTAHYDHLGLRDGVIYNGADDNASGVATLLALARHLQKNPPRHTVVIAALDAEELGLRGAEAFLANPPLDRERIGLNVNLDMVGRNAQGELFAAGAYHYPFLRPLLEGLAEDAPIRLRLGHDSPDLPRAEDWTQQSDHGVFHAAGIPFVYFGVEDHPDYHRPTDDAERIDPGFLAGAVATIIEAVERFDEQLPTLD